MKRMILLVVICAAVAALPLWAQQGDSAAATDNPPAASQPAPRLILFGGTVKDLAGKPLAGPMEFHFAIYKEQADGAPLWEESQTLNVDEQGHYAVLLGATEPEGLPADLFATRGARWLGVTVGGLPERPRTLLVSVPYALEANDAQMLGGKPASAYLLAQPAEAISPTAGPKVLPKCPVGGGTVTSVGSGAGLTGGPITSSGTLSIATGAVTNAMLQKPSLTVTAGSGLSGGGLVSLGGSTTLSLAASGITNAMLQSPSLTVAAGSGLSGGGVVALGGSTTLSLAASGITNAMLQSPSLTVAAGNGLAGGGSVSLGGSTTLSLSPNIVGSTGTFSASLSASTAVFSGSNNPVVSGTNAATASQGQLGSGQFGVYGQSASSGGGSGVYGYNTNSTGGYGLFGWSSGTGGMGVSGTNPLGLGGYGVYGYGDTGVFGYSSSGSSAGWGAYGYNTSPTAGGGVRGDSFGLGGIGVLGYSYNATSGTGVQGEGVSYGVFAVGNLGATGTKSAVVALPDDRVVELYAMESPENWFEDFGSGELRDGVADVTLEPTFALAVNTGAAYHVFLTPAGDCAGLYVAQKTGTGFQVRELRGGKSNVGFDYRIVAKRRGYESVRMEQLEVDPKAVKTIREEPQRRPVHRRLILPKAPEEGPMPPPQPPRSRSPLAASREVDPKVSQ